MRHHTPDFYHDIRIKFELLVKYGHIFYFHGLVQCLLLWASTNLLTSKGQITHQIGAKLPI